METGAAVQSALDSGISQDVLGEARAKSTARLPGGFESCADRRTRCDGSARLQRLQLVAQAGRLLVRLLADCGLEFLLQFTHATRAFEPGRILTR